MLNRLISFGMINFVKKAFIQKKYKVRESEYNFRLDVNTDVANIIRKLLIILVNSHHFTPNYILNIFKEKVSVWYTLFERSQQSISIVLVLKFIAELSNIKNR